MNRDDKQKLIDALVEDTINNIYSSSNPREMLREIFRNGFSGYDMLTVDALLQCAEDAGLKVNADG